MKKALLAGVAALFLATGTAHATETYQCGDVTVTLGARTKAIHIAFETAGFDSDKKQPTTDVHASIKWKRNGKGRTSEWQAMQTRGMMRASFRHLRDLLWEK